MNVELICVGSELLSGNIVNTNASFISKRLRELGHESFRQFTVDDNKKRLSELISSSINRCDILILTGGLGPTADDITKETVCETLGLELIENPVCKKHIDDYFRVLGKTPTKNNYKQTTAPRDAVIFQNTKGTACGVAVEFGSKHIIMLPGPPKELAEMFRVSVVPYLKKLTHHAIVSHTLNVFGMGESAIETLIKPLCLQKNPTVATYCAENECNITVTATEQDEQQAEALCRKTIIEIKQLLGDYVYGCDSDGLASVVVNSLRSSGLTISTAESCTGGMLSEMLTSVPHASQVVEIGILAYSNRIKNEALSVPRDVLEDNGAISPETAMYLAKNVRILSGSDIGIGITGNAGPTASENKPVGLVYVAIADKTKYMVKRLKLPDTYDRERIRNFATLTALDLVRRYVNARPQILTGMVSYDDASHYTEEYLDSLEVGSSAITEEKPKDFDPNVNFIVFSDEEATEDTANKPISNDFYFETDIDFNTSGTNNDNQEAALGQFKIEKEKRAEEKKFVVKEKLLSLLRKFFPAKNDKTADIIIKVISIIAAVTLLISSIALIAHFSHENQQKNIINTARDNFSYNNNNKNDKNQQYSAFDDLIKQNSDIKAWISISNTNINNPVYQTKDNDFYLNHNMLKEKSRYGALFFDFNNKIEQNNSKNITIYGHNMKDKSMFGSLNNYRSLSFYKENPIIKLKTLYNQADYAIFAIMITNASAKDDNGYIYNFTRTNFNSTEDFTAWLDEAKERSIINSGVSVTANDEILTLSTCCYDFNNARFVVMAKKIIQGEARPNFSDAKLNANVRYPKAWYDKKGLAGYQPSTSSNDSSSNSSSNISSDVSSHVTQEESSEDMSSVNSSDTSSKTVCDHAPKDAPTNANAENHTFVCSKCSDVLSSEKHTYNQETKSVLKSEATCADAAQYYKTCICGALGADTYTVGEPTGEHQFGDWFVETPATETTEGVQKRSCTVCSHTESDTIPTINSENNLEE